MSRLPSVSVYRLQTTAANSDLQRRNHFFNVFMWQEKGIFFSMNKMFEGRISCKIANMWAVQHCIPSMGKQSFITLRTNRHLQWHFQSRSFTRQLMQPSQRESQVPTPNLGWAIPFKCCGPKVELSQSTCVISVSDPPTSHVQSRLRAWLRGVHTSPP